MARFTVRIELHYEDEYELLHEKMEEQGFLRTVTDTKSGIRYHLPNAEYNYEGPNNLTKSRILTIAKQAVRAMFADTHPGMSQERVDKRYQVLVTPSPGRTWHNLIAVEEDE